MYQRILILDTARGLAVLGILLLNIVAFALPSHVRWDPSFQGNVSPAAVWTWALLAIFAQSKFLSIFALLLGAGIQLLRPRGNDWVQARLVLLGFLGLIHGIFFWDGDILLTYSLIGLLCWQIIRVVNDAADLLKTGIMLYFFGAILLVLMGTLIDSLGLSLHVDTETLQYEQEWKLRGGMEAWKNRVSLLCMNLLAVSTQYGWQLSGLILIGAGLMHNGWLRGERTSSDYRQQAAWMIAFSLMIQLPCIALQWYWQWDYVKIGIWLDALRELGAPIQSLGYLALLYGFWQILSGWRISGWLAIIGRMALSNYLLQTLICTTIFYHFEGYQKFERLQLLVIVLLIWLCNFWFSLQWSHYFNQGPAEWLWRQLTVWSCNILHRPPESTLPK